jgi:hypothetical protein
VGAVLELVGQRLETRWIVGAESMRKRLAEEPVGKPAVAR